MNVEKFREVIKRREYIEDISCGEWADGIEECQKQLIDILSEELYCRRILLDKRGTGRYY